MEKYTTQEEGEVEVCVVLTGQAERDVIARVSTADGEAQGCSK